MNNKELEDQIIAVIKTVYDPEIPVDVYELGLIYDVRIEDNGHIDVDMTLTSPSCPVAESLPAEVEEKIMSVEGVKTAKVKIVFDPPWTRDMMSEEAQLDLGFM